MTVTQAIELNVYTLRTLRSDESAGYIALVRTSDRIPDPSVRDTDGDDLRSAGITMDGDDDFFMTHLTDDFSDLFYAHAAGTPFLACIAPSECMLNNISAAFAGTVAEHVCVTTYRCSESSRRAYCSSKSWLTRTNATGRNDLQTAKTLIPRKKIMQQICHGRRFQLHRDSG
jgi:hypothetical protein